MPFFLQQENVIVHCRLTNMVLRSFDNKTVYTLKYLPLPQYKQNDAFINKLEEYFLYDLDFIVRGWNCIWWNMEAQCKGVFWYCIAKILMYIDFARESESIGRGQRM